MKDPERCRKIVLQNFFLTPNFLAGLCYEKMIYLITCTDSFVYLIVMHSLLLLVTLIIFYLLFRYYLKYYQYFEICGPCKDFFFSFFFSCKSSRQLKHAATQFCKEGLNCEMIYTRYHAIVWEIYAIMIYWHVITIMDNTTGWWTTQSCILVLVLLLVLGVKGTGVSSVL